MNQKDAERQEAAESLREFLTPGETVYTILRHCSTSGMSRAIDLFVIHNGEPCRITWGACKACGWRYDRKHEAAIAKGCGMDMGFHLVYSLGAAIYADGTPCTGKGCLSNAHSNGDQDYTPGKLHKDGGYTFNHRWL